MKLKRTSAVIAAAVLALSLTACGKDTENTSGGVSSMVQSTAADSSSSTAESSTSSLTAGSSDTSSAENPVEEPPQPKKIPLTGEELREIDIGPISTDFFKTYESSGRSFDLTSSIDNIEMFDFILGNLVRFIEKDEADYHEWVSDPAWKVDKDCWWFKPETAENLIREKFLPSFKISSVDHTASAHWDTEKGQFKVLYELDSYLDGRGRGQYDYLNESGYKTDDYYYINLVPLNDYPMADMHFYAYPSMDEIIKMSDITSEYFAIPRVRVKLKKFAKKALYDDYFFEVFILVGFEPVDDRPEWVHTAEQLFKDNDLENVEMIGINALEENTGFNTQTLRTAGVLSAPFGKRIYLYEKQYTERTLYRDYYHDINTFGMRGKNDNIRYVLFSESREGTGDYIGSQYHYIESSTLTCNDILSGVKYVHDIEEGFIEYYDVSDNNGGVARKDIHEESWKLNDKNISEAEYNSAEAVAYFLDSFKGDGKSAPYEFDTLYSCEVTDCITLGDYFEMCRIITD